MLISKFDLYKTEWLDLVFDDRNKDYGAYNLRRHYAGTMAKAMAATFLFVGALCAVSVIVNSQKEIVHVTHVHVNPVVQPVLPPIKHVEPPAAPQHAKPMPPKTIATIQHIPPVVVADNLARKPVENKDLDGPVAIGQATLKGEQGSAVEIPDPQPGTGTPAPDETVHAPVGLDFMPEPVGGSAAWSKFLQKNLRFPVAAQEEGISGKVYLSFIIEKDGHLSNITVDKAAGHGFDEEALRVLKLAKAWKPGMQNGQPVRVKYTIPITFQLSE